MTSEENMEKKLQELADSIAPDDKLVENVMKQVNRTNNKKPYKPIYNRLVFNRLTRLAAAAAITVAAFTAFLYLGGYIGGTNKLYAAAIKALQDVNTVHVTGWTTQVYPEHSSVFDEPLDANEQYQIEIWEWFTETGQYKIYDRQGPITLWDDGQRRYEYQAHNDILYIDESRPTKQLSVKFQTFTTDLESLNSRGIKTTDLGTRIIDGRQARGIRGERDNQRKEIWFDVKTNLMLENDAYILEDGSWKKYKHRTVTYDQSVPAEILAYVPPETGKIQYGSNIDPRFEKWNLRLREIAAYYQKHPLPETMELLPRESGEKFNAYAPGRLSDITNTTGHWVLPIQSSLGDFLRRNFYPPGTLRVPEEFEKIQLNHDLITKNEHTARDRIAFVLDTLGFNLTEVNEPRKVWIAHYDGRPLKPWRQVKAPVPNPEHVGLRPGMASVFSPFSIKELFDSFIYWQDYDLTADKIIIIDETSLPSEPEKGQGPESIAVSSESPYWGGEESIEIAKNWFFEQFDITFTEEIRPMKIYIVHPGK